MSEIDTQNWSWWATGIDGPNDTPETYTINESTREAVIAVARRDYPGYWIAVVEATQDGPFDARPFDEDGGCRAIDIALERFQDDNCERWGEDGGEFALSTSALAKRLNDTFEQFIADNHHAVMEGAWSFTGTRNSETLPPLASSA